MIGETPLNEAPQLDFRFLGSVFETHFFPCCHSPDAETALRLMMNSDVGPRVAHPNPATGHSRPIEGREVLLHLRNAPLEASQRTSQDGAQGRACRLQRMGLPEGTGLHSVD